MTDQIDESPEANEDEIIAVVDISKYTTEHLYELFLMHAHRVFDKKMKIEKMQNDINSLKLEVPGNIEARDQYREELEKRGEF